MQFKRDYICPECGVKSTWTSLDCPECGFTVYSNVVKHVELDGATTFFHDEYGLGVCATKNMLPRTLIESSPAYLQERMEYVALTQGMTFQSSSKGAPISGQHLFLPWFFDQARGMALGKAMLFNHSFDPNVAYYFREDSETGRYFYDFVTTREVRTNEELTISYGDEVWFPPYTKAQWLRNERIRLKREALEEKDRK